MATPKKQSRKQLKQPDEFVQTGNTFVRWIEEHRRPVVLAVVAVVVVGFAAAVTATVLSRQSAEAGEALGRALALANYPVVADVEDGDDSFPSAEARREAVTQALQRVREEHPGTDAASLAALQLGELAFAADGLDAAAEHYETFLDETVREHAFRYAGLEGLALVAEARGDDAQAAQAWQRVVDEGNAFYRPFALVQLARTLERLGQADEARAKAQQVMDSWPDSPAAADAQTLLSRLPGAPVEEAPADSQPAAPAAGNEG